MSMNDSYAPVPVWDTYHAALVTEGEELNPQGWWVPGLLPFLLTAGAQSVLDVGCGTGGDAVGLAQKGFHVTAMDYSQIALPLLAHKPKQQQQTSLLISARAIWPSPSLLPMRILTP